MRAWVHVELREDQDSPVACELGRWATFATLPRIGEEVFWSDDNYPGWSLTVSRVEHFLQPDEDESIVRVVMVDDGCEEMADDDDPGWHIYRDLLLENGFKITDCLWEADE